MATSCHDARDAYVTGNMLHPFTDFMHVSAGFLAEGLQRVPAGVGSVIIDSQPLTVAVVAALVFGESITPLGVFGLFLGLAGLLLLELPEDQLAALSTLDFGTLPMPQVALLLAGAAAPSHLCIVYPDLSMSAAAFTCTYFRDGLHAPVCGNGLCRQLSGWVRRGVVGQRPAADADGGAVHGGRHSDGASSD